jgi:hypothetical protein
LSRLSPAFVLGYHGCDADVAERVLAGGVNIRFSKNDYDWLGSGAYFWEADPNRALQWAKEATKRRKILKPAVLGAVIDLRSCLNLSTQDGVGLLKVAYDSYRELRQRDGDPLALNQNPATRPGRDKLLRRLDNAVIERLHIIMKETERAPFDTVRGMFREGNPVYPDAGFWERTHVQIAVRNPDCIIGYFRPR